MIIKELSLNLDVKLALDQIEVIDPNTIDDSYPVIPNFIIKVEIK